jgi:hypothetical protein
MKIARMKSSRGTDVLPWILVGLSAVIMGVAVGVYSSDASATDTSMASEAAPALIDASGPDASNVQAPASVAADHTTARESHPAQL